MVPHRRGDHRTTLLALFLLLILSAATLPLPEPFHASARSNTNGTSDETDESTTTSQTGTDGQDVLADLRLYGCSATLGSQDSPQGPKPVRPRDPAQTHGHLDCTGDRVRIPPAFYDNRADPFSQLALGPRDQTNALTLRYLPTAWAPAPGFDHGPGSPSIADPTRPSRGLFDRGTSAETANVPDGRLDLHLISDEDVRPGLDEDDRHDPIDLASPQDGVPDHTPRHLDPSAPGDHYFPAIEVRYDIVWTDPNGDTVPLTNRSTFRLPTDPRSGAAPGLDDEQHLGRPTAVTWHARPFGQGTDDDDHGAIVTPTLLVREGDEIRFLDHGVKIGVLADEGTSTIATMDITYEGAARPEPLWQDVVLRNDRVDESSDATIDQPGRRVENVVLADRLGIRRNALPPERPTASTADDAWFVLLENVSTNDDNESIASIRIGRIISTSPPNNAFFADRAFYIISALDEREGHLHRFALSQWIPLGPDIELRRPGVTLTGIPRAADLPLMAPFDAEHARLQDHVLRPQRDTHGFLQATKDTTAASGISSSTLRLGPTNVRPVDRITPADALEIRWTKNGTESALTTNRLMGPGDATLARQNFAADRWVGLRLPPGPNIVHSTLLDDQDLLTPTPGLAQRPITFPTTAPIDPATKPGPRAHRTFIFDPTDPQPALYQDAKVKPKDRANDDDANAAKTTGDGTLLLAGARYDRPETGDILHPEPAIIRWNTDVGKVRTPNALAHELVQLNLQYVPYARYNDLGRGLVPVNDETIDPNLDADTAKNIVDRPTNAKHATADHLHDVEPQNTDPARGDIYGPALRTETTYRFLERSTYDRLEPNTDARTTLLIPIASRRPNTPGLDSFDTDGDGDADPLILRGWWDLQGGTQSPGQQDDDQPTSDDIARPRFVTSGTDFDTQQGPDQSDLLWVRTPTLELRPNENAQLFDHGIEITAIDRVGTGHAASVRILDARNIGEPEGIATKGNVGPDGRECVFIDVAHDARAPPGPCDSVHPTSGTVGQGPRADDTLWWAEVVAVFQDRAQVILNRVLTDTDREPAGDERIIFVDGARHEIAAIRFTTAQEPESPQTTPRDRFASLTMARLVPIGANVPIDPTNPDQVLVGVRPGQTLPLPPPYSEHHETLQVHGLSLERDVYGFADHTIDADPDLIQVRPEERVKTNVPLDIQIIGRASAVTSLLYADATRLVDGDRAPGHIFTAGIFAEPSPSESAQTTVPSRLVVDGPDGLDGAMTDQGDRVWSERLQVGLPKDHGLFLLETPRLGPQGIEIPERQAANNASWWLFDPMRSGDVYLEPVASLVEDDDGAGDGGNGVGNTDNGDEPKTETGKRKRSPAGAPLILVAILAAGLRAARRRRSN